MMSCNVIFETLALLMLSPLSISRSQIGMIYYAAPGLAAYVLDRTARLCSMRRPCRLVSMTVPVAGFVRLTIAIDRRCTFEPGQWVLVNIPAVSFLQWHPMSVASAPGHSTVTIDVKVLGDWTTRLQEFAVTHFDAENPQHTRVFVDGFYGSNHCEMQGYLNHPAVLMFAGGIGITPMISAFRSLIENPNRYASIRRAVLVWCVKKVSVLELYRLELARMQNLGRTANGCEIEVIVHATLSEKEDPQADVIAPPIPTGSSEERDYSKEGHPPAFREHVLGYGHKMALTIGSGCGYLLGIFLANYISYERDWLQEYVALLQLSLAVICSTGIVALAMHPAFGNYFSQRNARTVSDDAPTRRLSHSASANFPVVNEASPDLQVTLGCRPDVVAIVDDTKAWCESSGIATVGVSACGPKSLIRRVVQSCSEASSSSLAFIVDEETFDL